MRQSWFALLAKATRMLPTISPGLAQALNLSRMHCGQYHEERISMSSAHQVC
jgi:hypothetical protein